jgi:hypothetical protein
MTQRVPVPLSRDWAFVVQLREGTLLHPDRMEGRIEHIASGQAVAFTSLKELRAFMERIVARREQGW